MPTSTAHRNRHAAAGAPAGAPCPIDDTRITEITELAPPSHLLREFPASERAAATTYDARAGDPSRSCTAPTTACWSSSGPCSIHDYDAAIDYATRLAALEARARRRPRRS